MIDTILLCLHKRVETLIRSSLTVRVPSSTTTPMRRASRSNERATTRRTRSIGYKDKRRMLGTPRITGLQRVPDQKQRRKRLRMTNNSSNEKKANQATRKRHLKEKKSSKLRLQ